ncbi:TIGR03756 family integrating conjugative element protein [Actinobacillus delphinicola]|uniref:TIGR03756 family integrating conjugative element protein n=1 Tax=Actinobacillus delphinicola TaxID=51161 RepID=UPI0024418DB1|nr:TIGR03756 family integrating conjugative element protein [Actinobacillus delphinicola]
MKFDKTKISQKLQHCLVGLGVLACTLPDVASASSGVTVAQLLQSSSSLSCAEWRVKGICIWLTCTPFGCYTRTSVKVRHFLPESVVSVYDFEEDNPVAEAKMMGGNKFVTKLSTLGTPQGELTGGRFVSHNKRLYNQSHIKNAELIGHPGGMIYTLLGQLGYFCSSQSTPYMPYFLSGLDFLEWRYPTVEAFHPSSLTFFNRELRKGNDNWGNIYPRNGMVTQQHSYKGAALVAQRVADIVTRPFGTSSHLYFPLSKKSQPSNGKWYPKPVQELNNQNHKWQMLYPKLEQSCAIFPDKSSSGIETTDPYQDKLSPNHNYAWALWRPYECCKRRGQTLIFSN